MSTETREDAPDEQRVQRLQEEKDHIDLMSHATMARYQRFAPSGHWYFVKGTELAEYFAARFEQCGGMTPAISKEIGQSLQGVRLNSEGKIDVEGKIDRVLR